MDQQMNVARLGWEEEILQRLDEAAAGYELPGMPREQFFQAAQRLTAFRSEKEWLLAYEFVGYNARRVCMEVAVQALGNGLEQQGVFDGVTVIARPDGSSPWDVDEKTGKDVFGLSTDGPFEVAVWGRVHNLQPTNVDRLAARVESDDMVEPARVIRLLASMLGDELFLPTDRLLEICEREDVGLEPLLVLGNWQQPDVGLGGEIPSDMPGLRSLAKAVAAGDAGLYDCPESAQNADWWNWNDEE